MINLNIMISHPNRKQWLKIYESIFFSDVGFVSCAYVNYSSMKAKRQSCSALPKFLRKRTDGLQAAFPLDSQQDLSQRKLAMSQGSVEQTDKRPELWSGAWRSCHAELPLPQPKSDPIVLEPTSARGKCTSARIRIGPSECHH